MSGILLPDAPLINTTITTGAALMGPFPVQDVESLFVNLSGPTAAAAAGTFTFSWPDFSIQAPNMVINGNAMSLPFSMRNQGPQLQIAFSGPVGPKFGIQVWPTNRVLEHDGPYTPSQQGTKLHGQAYALAAGGFQQVALWGTGGQPINYCGPATVGIRATSLLAGTNCNIDLSDDTGQVLESINVASPNYSDTAQWWLPPRPLGLSINNPGTVATTIYATLLATT